MYIMAIGRYNMKRTINLGDTYPYLFFLCVCVGVCVFLLLYCTVVVSSSLQKFYGRHDNIVDRYEISMSPMTMDILLLT